MKFYVGLHHPSDAKHFERCMVSVNALRGRKGDFVVNEWMLDSGAFTEVTKHGGFRHDVQEYAEQINRWSRCGNLVAASAQDYMCEPFALMATGKTVGEHQQLTVDRYAALRPLTNVYVLPVLQGFEPSEYVSHVRQYGSLLSFGAWVGVGSVCKRNGKVSMVENVLTAIHRERPDLKLHGFGLKLTALQSAIVRDLLHSSDSMAWSYAARREGRNGNDWREAERYRRRIDGQSVQENLFNPARSA